MAYLGNTPTTQNFVSGTDYFNGTGAQTAFTLSRTVNSINDIQAVVNNVVQQPNDAYTLSGTTITFTSAPSSGTNNVYVRYLSTTTQVITPSQNSVGTAQLAPLTTIPVVGGYTVTLPSATGTIALTSQITSLIKKISTYEYATRTNPSASAGTVAFTWTSSFTMIDRVNNGLLVMAWVPANDQNTKDYTGHGLRFTNGTTNYDTQGKGSNYVGAPSFTLAMSMQQYGFWVPANSVPTGTLTLQHYLYTADSSVLLCPNSSDDSRLNQTSAQLIIIEYGI